MTTRFAILRAAKAFEVPDEAARHARSRACGARKEPVSTGSPSQAPNGTHATEIAAPDDPKRTACHLLWASYVSHGDAPRRYGLIMSTAGSQEDPLAGWDPRRRAALDRIRRQFKDAGGDQIDLVDELLSERRMEAAAQDHARIDDEVIVEIRRGPEPAGE